MSYNSRRNISAYILCYALLVVLFVVAAANIFIWRVALLEIISVVMGRSYANRSVYMLGMVGVGIASFVVVMASEPYLRFGVERGLLMHRFWRMFMPLTGIAVLGLVLQFVLQG